jgi:hypothetical protein
MSIPVRQQNQVACGNSELTVVTLDLEQTSAPSDSMKSGDGLSVHAEGPRWPEIRPAVHSATYVEVA